MQNVIQDRLSFCEQFAAARREAGLSQQALADKIGVSREKVARLEAGSGSVALLVQTMSAIPMRMLGVAKGRTIIDQIGNARAKRKWTEHQLARATGLDVRTIAAVEQGRGTVGSLVKILHVLAPRAARQPVARIFWDFDRARMSETDCRFTPPEFLAAVEKCFGKIGLDPCWHSGSAVSAERTIALPDCGLSANWGGSGLVWCNPPYSHLANWIGKANTEWASGNVKKLLLLFPASRLDVREFFDRSASYATTLILRERLTFARFDGHQKGYPSPFALALACFGCTPEELAAFGQHYPALVILPRNSGLMT